MIVQPLYPADDNSWTYACIKVPFKLCNFCKGKYTASVLPNGEDDQPAVEEESLNVQENHPAVVHVQPLHPADDKPLDGQPIQSAVNVQPIYPTE